MAKRGGRDFQPKAVEVYTPEKAAYMHSQGADIRGEYAVLRHRAEQRLRDLKAGGGENLDVYRDYVHRFPSLREIGKGSGMDKQLLYDAMAEVTRFLNMRQSTIGGYHASIREAHDTFREHYVDTGELPDIDPKVFGELMRAIKSHANAAAYYKGWKKAYRELVNKSEAAGIDPDALVDALNNGDVVIGPKGGLYDPEAQRYISAKWRGPFA